MGNHGASECAGTRALLVTRCLLGGFCARFAETDPRPSRPENLIFSLFSF